MDNLGPQSGNMHAGTQNTRLSPGSGSPAHDSNGMDGLATAAANTSFGAASSPKKPSTLAQENRAHMQHMQYTQYRAQHQQPAASVSPLMLNNIRPASTSLLDGYDDDDAQHNTQHGHNSHLQSSAQRSASAVVLSHPSSSSANATSAMNTSGQLHQSTTSSTSEHTKSSASSSPLPLSPPSPQTHTARTLVSLANPTPTTPTRQLPTSGAAPFSVPAGNHAMAGGGGDDAAAATAATTIAVTTMASVDASLPTKRAKQQLSAFPTLNSKSTATPPSVTAPSTTTPASKKKTTTSTTTTSSTRRKKQGKKPKRAATSPFRRRRPNTARRGQCRNFVCKDCGKAFKHKTHFTRHVFTHNNPPTFVCGYTLSNGQPCQQGFYRRDHYEYHCRQHTGEKPFECQVKDCGQSFRQASALRRHMQRIHKGVASKSSSSSSSSASAAAASGTKQAAPAKGNRKPRRKAGSNKAAATGPAPRPPAHVPHQHSDATAQANMANLAMFQQLCNLQQQPQQQQQQLNARSSFPRPLPLNSSSSSASSSRTPLSANNTAAAPSLSADFLAQLMQQMVASTQAQVATSSNAVAAGPPPPPPPPQAQPATVAMQQPEQDQGSLDIRLLGQLLSDVLQGQTGPANAMQQQQQQQQQQRVSASGAVNSAAYQVAAAQQQQQQQQQQHGGEPLPLNMPFMPTMARNQAQPQNSNHGQACTSSAAAYSAMASNAGAAFTRQSHQRFAEQAPPHPYHHQQQHQHQQQQQPNMNSLQQYLAASMQTPPRRASAATSFDLSFLNMPPQTPPRPILQLTVSSSPSG
ncbi:zinc finger protein zfp2 [Salpingoeca rosetta]|uniref:Zinc finger protein zfp2 n=1 Tax=Salpingoeca rosetta (strain ATCC 50818 / BSB-021) TaxID=946362 RepID=F2UE44_SALR5|nr:zinc finger protein zfp2 [Salpingoeca rosetta]EGD74894.1 zinc finger protein zfp2 [Salpingoeca rosetta]|eukprot:XP_004992539.1 zinc finger protein zfp2 [Salpingoeca rosetta]